MVKRKELVEHVVINQQASLKRACRLFKLSQTVYKYRAKRKLEDPIIAQKLQSLSEKHRRYGFWKLYALIRREGLKWNNKRVYRIYCELRLNLRRRPKKRLPSREKISLLVPPQLNVCWSLDFMSDAIISGRRFRTVNVLDDCNREALGIKASFFLPGEEVTIFLDEIGMRRGYPMRLRVDNAPENISKMLQYWAEKHKVKLTYISQESLLKTPILRGLTVPTERKY